MVTSNQVPTQAGEEIQSEAMGNEPKSAPKHRWNEAMIKVWKKFGKFSTSPFCILVTIYGLNIVAWGGMLFLLICNAVPAMCKPTCNDINSPRRIWIEIDSQILNGLFCVTGFGLIPWRFRDLWYWTLYRVFKKDSGLLRLAGTNKKWFRLPVSQDVPRTQSDTKDPTTASESGLLNPESKNLKPPLSDVLAPPTAIWKLDLVIWTMIWNTLFQAMLSGLMWGLNRHKRPGWSTGILVTLACLAGGIGSLVSSLEGKKVKAIESVPVSQLDLTKLGRDVEVADLSHCNQSRNVKIA
ncbi:putative alpha-l-rhamnosidase c [Golovinomyces cichoracearum]|uniref:Putative alpha-l-rhamnosidase c n=1 Tax=Golovinomyces cichoracearum TaxID=62708 RepID=A0A420H8V4_9PEZI|nr:putative alpha-l-rhamnosidase c [Golovinomyces cichoracearum]